MYLQHFGLRHPPLGKDIAEPWDDGALEQLTQRFNWLLQSPGLGLLTGEPGVGKTAALRSLTRALNPHRHLVLYQANTDFATSVASTSTAAWPVPWAWSRATGVRNSGATSSCACTNSSTPSRSRRCGSLTRRKTYRQSCARR